MKVGSLDETEDGDGDEIEVLKSGERGSQNLRVERRPTQNADGLERFSTRQLLLGTRRARLVSGRWYSCCS